MDIPWNAIGTGAQMAGGVIGMLTAQNPRYEQERLLREVYEKLRNIDPKDFPALQAALVGESAAGQVTADPEMRRAQIEAMSRLKEMADNGGLTLEDMAAQNKAMGQVARQEGAGRQRILESMAQRGMGGSGAELAASLQNQQGAAERANEVGMDTAGRAQRRAFEAIMGRGRMAGDMRTQGFNEQMQAAQAKDLRERYNADKLQRTNEYNAETPHRILDARIRAAGGQAAAANNLSGLYGQQADRNQQFWTSMGAAGREAFRDAGSGSGGGYGYSAPPLLSADEDEWNIWPGYDIRDGDK